MYLDVTPPTAKSLILDLASTADGEPMPAQGLVQVAAVFGISENNVRVALARLLARGLLERNERGRYSLARSASAVQRHVGSWTDAETRRVEWRGGWVAVSMPQPKGRGAAVKRERQALDFLGFRHLEPTLLIRPDNLLGGVPASRAHLAELGLGAATLVFRLEALDPSAEARARGLWDTGQLDRGYRALRVKVERSCEGLPEMALADAVVECFVLGGEVLRRMAYDPLLPDVIQAPDERQALVDEMRRYDRVGRAAWRRCFGLALPVSPLRSCVVSEPAPERRSSL